MTDPFVGKLTYVRVYSGRAESGSYVINASNGQRERLGRILEMNAAERIDRDDAAAGDIVACVGFKNSTTGDTLCAEGKEIVLEKIEFAKPVIDVAIEPKTKAEQDKMSLALTKLAEEDPTFTVSTNHETGQTIIAGMGELHLEIIVDRLLREFKVDANVGKPQVAYRETAGHDVEKAEASSSVSPAVAVSTATPSSSSRRWRRASATSSSTLSSAASCPRSTSRPSIRHPGGPEHRCYRRLPGPRR